MNLFLYIFVFVFQYLYIFLYTQNISKKNQLKSEIFTLYREHLPYNN